MSIPSPTFPALTTVFTPPPFCSDRYAVFIGTPTPVGGLPSTNTPSSGWIDPSFSTCNPPQYTNAYPTFSPGVCPSGMTIVASTSNVDGAKTVWTGACCESGFSQMDAQYLCTSTVTTPMAFLLDPNISTTDIYTTLSSLYIEHDQLAVLWEETDLAAFPTEVAAQYASIMNVAVPTSSAIPVTDHVTTTAIQSPAASIEPQPTSSTTSSTTTSTTTSEANSQSSKESMPGTSENAGVSVTPQSFVAVSSASPSQIRLWPCFILLLSGWMLDVA